MNGLEVDRHHLIAMLDELPIGVIMAAAPSGHILLGNRMIRRLLGGNGDTSPEPVGEIEDYTHWIGFHPDGRRVEAAEWPLARALHEGAAIPSADVRVPRTDAPDAWVRMTAIPVRDPQGLLTAALATVEDLTELHRIDGELLDARRMETVGRLAGGVAHDFNNLLTAILGGATLARLSLPANSPAEKDLKDIEGAARRAAALTHQLLAFSRRDVLRLRPVDLNAVVSEAASILSRVVGEEVVLDIALGPSPLGAVRADRGQIEQVLLNLVVNARDAMTSGGTVTVETARVILAPGADHPYGSLTPGRYVRLSVRDTGVGMDANTKSRLFEPFFTTKAAGIGTGLGLATVLSIITQAGGTMHVDSALGEGSTFSAVFPVVDEPVTEIGLRVPILPRGTETILIVEDERVVRDTARRVLERQGYHVLEARHGADALLVWREKPNDIDLVISDLRMPEMDGWSLAQILHEERPDLPLLLMSGYASEPNAATSAERANLPLLHKPFDSSDLVIRIRQMLDASTRRRTAPYTQRDMEDGRE